MKVVISQTYNQFMTTGSNQIWNVSKVEVNGAELYSVGAESISLALYRKQKHAMAALKAVSEFIVDDERKSFQFDVDCQKARP